MTAAVAATVMVATCQAPPREADWHTSGIDIQTGDSQLPEFPAMAILPLIMQQRTFKIVEGDDDGTMVAMVLRRAEADEPGEWVLDMKGLNTMYLTQDDEGNVLVVRMDLPRDGYALNYNPAVRMVPSRLHPDLLIEEQSQARVHNLKTGELEHTGKALHTVKSVTRRQFETPDGDQDGYMVAIEQSIDLPLADLTMDMEVGYLPGEGMVYRRLRYTILRLGIFETTTRRTAVIVE